MNPRVDHQTARPPHLVGETPKIAVRISVKTELPNFRRFSSFNAYIEGWALYAERLGLVNGFYCSEGLIDEDEGCEVAGDPRGWGLATRVE